MNLETIIDGAYAQWTERSQEKYSDEIQTAIKEFDNMVSLLLNNDSELSEELLNQHYAVTAAFEKHGFYTGFRLAVEILRILTSEVLANEEDGGKTQ